MSQNFPLRVATEFVSTSEGNIRILVRRVSPTYPWLVLSPGQGDAAESLFMLFEISVNQQINIVVFDPPGHGLSDEPRADYSPKSQQVVWESVLEHLKVSRAYIGGYSYGAYSAAMCGGSLADRIVGLILIEGGYLTMKQKGVTVESETEDILESMSTYRFGSWDEALEVIRSQATTWTYYDEAEFYTSMVERDGAIVLRVTDNTIIQMEQTLGDYSIAVMEELTCHILLLHSTLPAEREETRAGGLALFHYHAPHAKIVPIPNCGHTIKEHLPFVMNQIAEFIRDVV